MGERGPGCVTLSVHNCCNNGVALCQKSGEAARSGSASRASDSRLTELKKGSKELGEILLHPAREREVNEAGSTPASSEMI